MLEYAARRPVVAARPSSPNTMLLIVGAHVALIAAVLSVKMDLPEKVFDAPIKIKLIKADPPPVRRIQPKSSPTPAQSTLSQTPRIVPVATTSTEITDALPKPPEFGGLVGLKPVPAIDPAPRPLPANVAAQLLTPAAERKPPYPQSKLLGEEQAVLKLRLTIDERGRVVAVDPLSRVDPVFLDAARRHILAHWRYRPASEAGRAVASAAVITLHFRLDG